MSCQSLDTVYYVKVNGMVADDVYWMLGVSRSRSGRQLLDVDKLPLIWMYTHFLRTML
jgi:hypothetical protein